MLLVIPAQAGMTNPVKRVLPKVLFQQCVDASTILNSGRFAKVYQMVNAVYQMVNHNHDPVAAENHFPWKTDSRFPDMRILRLMGRFPTVCRADAVC